MKNPKFKIKNAGGTSAARHFSFFIFHF